MTWSTSTGDAGDPDTAIRAQLFSDAGTAIGSEFLVNTTTAGGQNNPSVSTLTGGGFVITWDDSSAASTGSGATVVRGQIYGPAGARVGSEFLVSRAAGLNSQKHSTVAPLPGGGFVVAWMNEERPPNGQINTGSPIEAQIFSAAGAKVGSQIRVDAGSDPAFRLDPSVASLSGGGFVIAWADSYSNTGGFYGIRARLFTAAGSSDGSEFTVNTTSSGTDIDPDVAALAGGGFVVTWTDSSETGADTSSTAIRGQIYSGSGARVGSEFIVNTTTAGAQGSSSVVALASGGFVATWVDATGRKPRSQIFDGLGAKVGSEFAISDTTTTYQTPDVAALTLGRLVVVYRTFGLAADTSGGGVGAQLVSAGPDSATLSVGSRAFNHFTTRDYDDQNLVSSSATQIQTSNGITRITYTGSNLTFDSSGAPLSGSITGVSAFYLATGETVLSATFTPVLATQLLEWANAPPDAGAANEIGPLFRGLFAGADSLSGGEADDFLVGFAGADSLNGGAGNDFLDGDEVSDSAGGNDTLDGGEGSDVVRGLAGNDRIYGAAGADDVNGNMGQDTVSGGGGADLVRGGQGNDVVYGDDGDDVHVNGNIGNDTVYGGIGNDVLFGGQSNDRLYGEAGDDTLSGDLGSDTLVGGAGGDRFAFSATAGTDTVSDFSFAEGDRIQLPTGTVYTVASGSGGATISFASNSITLTGITAASVASSWVVFG